VRSFFELTIKKFGLLNHIDGTIDVATVINDPEWLQIDACIVLWFYFTVSKDIRNDVFKPSTSAYSTWTVRK
jgi:hypothetical protein